ncbi:MAG: pentapeptide repeat-containing protein [Anaerolineaceae bacterium]|nr:pentapeptide repeat-containing protein [Anaerolineaceae bacterium]
MNDLQQLLDSISEELVFTIVTLLLLLIVALVLFGIGERLKTKENNIPQPRYRRKPSLYLAPIREPSYTETSINQIPNSSSWKVNILQSCGTSLLSAVFYALTFGILVTIVQQHQYIQNQKAELILQLGSPDNSIAIEAVRQLDRLQWLYDGTLDNSILYGNNLSEAYMDKAVMRNVNLNESCLRHVRLYDADLKNSQLYGADLENALLDGINLENAALRLANLVDASLGRANLKNTNLQEVDLEGADLRSAMLQGADLQGSNLRNANLSSAEFDTTTLLPDSTQENPVYWTSGIDLERYTNAEHPNFWQPEQMRIRTIFEPCKF